MMSLQNQGAGMAAATGGGEDDVKGVKFVIYLYQVYRRGFGV